MLKPQLLFPIRNNFSSESRLESQRKSNKCWDLTNRKKIGRNDEVTLKMKKRNWSEEKLTCCEKDLLWGWGLWVQRRVENLEGEGEGEGKGGEDGDDCGVCEEVWKEGKITEKVL
jgi:hypothetical protein